MSDSKDSSADVAFLFKTMRERDPNKRRVKPVAKHLIQVDFGNEDESDDGDYHPDPQSEGRTDSYSDRDESKSDRNDDESNNSAEEDGDDESDDVNDDDATDNTDESENSGAGGSEGSGEGHESTQSDEEDEDDDRKRVSMKSLYSSNFMVDDEDDEEYIPKSKKLKETTPTQSIITTKSKAAERITKKATQKSSPKISPQSIRHLKVLVCGICLADNSEVEEEIIECDNCGISVHEGCFGLSDSHSVASSDSSASTEPWFCDVCKAGISPTCELCPNLGGIFKETDAGKWAHLVCCLYIPGVAFGDIEKLSPVTLFEMPYSKWGAKQCTLCEDSSLSSTGVCICCDAGMCRTYFHVSCAQKFGLLSQVSMDEVHEIADPFFAYCKLHAEKGVMEMKKRNWLTFQSHLSQFKQFRQTQNTKQDKVSQLLDKFQRKYQLARAKRPPSWVPTTKMVRYLSSSPSAVRSMLRKAELMGLLMQADSVSAEKGDVRKKPYVSAAFTAEFVSYFIERNKKISGMKQSIDDLVLSNQKLHYEETNLRANYEQMEKEMERLSQNLSTLKASSKDLYKLMSSVAGMKIRLPKMLQDICSPKSPTRRTSHTRDHVIHKCDICGRSNDQHLLANCDSCKSHLHLGCLDPPLSRMPKKTKLQGWQCSKCMTVSSDVSNQSDVDMNAPRQLRKTVTGPRRFGSFSQSSSSEVKTSNQQTKRRKGKSDRRSQKRCNSPPVLEKVMHIDRNGSDSRRNVDIKLGHSQMGRKIVSSTNKAGGSREFAARRALKRGNLVRNQTSRAESQVAVISSEQRATKHPHGRVQPEFSCRACSGEISPGTGFHCDRCQARYHSICLPLSTKTQKLKDAKTWLCESCAPQSTESFSTDDSDPPTLTKECG